MFVSYLSREGWWRSFWRRSGPTSGTRSVRSCGRIQSPRFWGRRPWPDWRRPGPSGPPPGPRESEGWCSVGPCRAAPSRRASPRGPPPLARPWSPIGPLVLAWMGFPRPTAKLSSSQESSPRRVNLSWTRRSFAPPTPAAHGLKMAVFLN